MIAEQRKMLHAMQTSHVNLFYLGVFACTNQIMKPGQEKVGTKL